MLTEQKGDRSGDELLFQFDTRFDSKVYNTIIKKAAEDLAWDQELSFHTHGFRHGGIGFFMEETGARFSDEDLREMLDMSRCMIQYYAIPNAKRKRDAQGAATASTELLSAR